MFFHSRVLGRRSTTSFPSVCPVASVSSRNTWRIGPESLVLGCEGLRRHDSLPGDAAVIFSLQRIAACLEGFKDVEGLVEEPQIYFHVHVRRGVDEHFDEEDVGSSGRKTGTDADLIRGDAFQNLVCVAVC